MEYLLKNPHTSWCEWKGKAHYYDVQVRGSKVSRAAWFYPGPVERFRDLAGYVAFYAEPMDACFVNGRQVRPQPGNFYGGWITDNIVGPFKGMPGTLQW